MSFVQRVMKKLVSARMAAKIEAESRLWLLRCKCGRAVSFWDVGGIRYRAAGRPRMLIRCPTCGLTWHRVEKRATPEAAGGGA